MGPSIRHLPIPRDRHAGYSAQLAGSPEAEPMEVVVEKTLLESWACCAEFCAL